MTLGNQIFIRFYLVIVISVIIVGWSVDYVWQSFEEEQQQDFYHEQILDLSTNLLAASSRENFAQTLSSINQISTHRVELVPKTQIQADSFQQALAEGEILTLENSSDSLVAYKLIPESDYLLAMYLPNEITQPWSKYALLILFYLLIAGVVYLWTRPLTRDLKILEDAASSFADSKWETSVDVVKSSPVNHLANAYNQLLVRIKQLLNDQQEMSHAISHELRTPLARIKFSIEMAINNNNPDAVREQLASISEDIVEIQSLVDELLSYASLEKSSTVANCERGDIESLISTLVEKLQRNSPDKKLSFEIEGDSKFVSCDSYLIERGLQNLIVNGLNHCRSRVSVCFVQIDNINRLVVDDDGDGIPEDNRDRVFDSFVRLDNNQQVKRKGFGLGLAIVKRIALLHQGQVKVDAAALGGARFVIEWPNAT